MTEVEKLRALLAEARAEVAAKEESLRIAKMIARRVQGERDEARTEVERLTADLEQVDSDLQLAVKRLTAEVEMLRGVGCQTADKAGEEPSGPCGVCRKCAYQRGAEAMREAAILAVEDDYYHQAIRALPIPEDK